MQRAREAIQGVFGLAVLAAIVVGLVAASRAALHYMFHGVSPTVAAAIVAASATGFLSLVTVLYQRRAERRQYVEQQLREKKVTVYTDLLGHVFDLFGIGEERSDEETEAVSAEALRQLSKLTPSMISWASDSVLLAWSRFRRSMFQTDGPLAQTLAFEQFLIAVRRDLGHANKEFRPGDLLALWIKDIDDYLVDGRLIEPPSAHS